MNSRHKPEIVGRIAAPANGLSRLSDSGLPVIAPCTGCLPRAQCEEQPSGHHGDTTQRSQSSNRIRCAECRGVDTSAETDDPGQENPSRPPDQSGIGDTVRQDAGRDDAQPMVELVIHGNLISAPSRRVHNALHAVGAVGAKNGGCEEDEGSHSDVDQA